jgi:tRNA G10  N-methylase Trm11
MELEGWSEANQVNLKFDHINGEVALVSGVSEKNVSKLIQDLGGLVKIATLLIEDKERKVDWVTKFSKLIQENIAEDKITFGLSWHTTLPQFTNRELSKIGLSIKRKLKDAGRKVRFVEPREKTLSSVQVTKNRLVDLGIELLIVEKPEGWLVGKTVAVQPFEDWSRRDYGRPKRDAKSGMLPPKLARMMLNMLGVKPDGILLDPFCGSGTIATEASALGWKKIVCSDISARAVSDTKQNVNWYKKIFNVNFELQASEVSIEKLSSLLKSDSINAIVTEGYLGPVLSKPARQKDIEKYRLELALIYKTLLREITRVLHDNGRAVITLPRWIDREGNEHTLLRLRTALPPGLRVRHFPNMSEYTPVYKREGQYVVRELVLLERKPRTK